MSEAGVTAAPMYFGPEERPLFGWLHRPRSPQGHGLAVVMCPPFGYEALCANRSLRHMARAIAEAGVPVLRIDYDGTGDSAGSDWDEGRLAAWAKSVHHAIDALRAQVGAVQVGLVGVRFGALVAAMAGIERNDVAGLAAVAPVVAGKAYVRELKVLQKTLKFTDPPAASHKPESNGEGVSAAAVQEAVGFVITPETQAAIATIDLAKLDRRPAPNVLLLDRDDMPGSDKWAAQLTALGARVDQRRVPGYVEMVLDPHKAVVPARIVAALAEWARGLAAEAPAAAPGEPLATPRTLARMPVKDARPVQEELVFVDEQRTLFGVLTTPARNVDDPPPEPSAPRPKAIVLLNAGSINHVGPNRLYVTLARQWAAQGHVVLRMDVAGIGESAPRNGAVENVVYTETSREDTAAALAFMRKRDVAECHAVGLCSGAYNALKGAVAGQWFDGIVMINPATFFWKPGMSLDFEYRESRVSREAERYSRVMLDPRAWMKLARGEVKLDAVAQVVSRRAMALAKQGASEIARRIGRPLPDDLGSELESVARRRIAMFFVFATNEPGLELLQSQGGSAARRLHDRNAYKLALIDGPDHTFTPLWAQERLIQILNDHFAQKTR